MLHTCKPLKIGRPIIEVHYFRKSVKVCEGQRINIYFLLSRFFGENQEHNHIIMLILFLIEGIKWLVVLTISWKNLKKQYRVLSWLRSSTPPPPQPLYPSQSGRLSAVDEVNSAVYIGFIAFICYRWRTFCRPSSLNSVTSLFQRELRNQSEVVDICFVAWIGERIHSFTPQIIQSTKHICVWVAIV